jgi:hypothetical protein
VGAAPPTLLVLLLFLVLSFLVFVSTWVAPGNRLVFGDVDVREITWFMGWTPYALSHGQTPLLTAHIDYPLGVNLMWNTAMIFPALVLSPITAVFGPITATNLAITLALPFSGWAMYLLARRYVRSRLAAIVAGLLYGFSPWMISRSPGEIHMTIAVFPPLALLALDEILIRQRCSRWLVGALLGVAAAAELLTSEEMLALTVMLAAVGVAVVAIPHWRLIPARLPYIVQSIGAAAVVFLALAAYPLAVQFFGPLRVTGVLPDAYATDLLALMIPTRWQELQFAQSISHQFTSRNIIEEGGAYIGIPLILIGLWVTFRFWSRGIVRVGTIVAITATVLAMGDHLHIRGHATHYQLPWRFLEQLPILKNVSPPRFMIFTYLMVALMLAVFVDWTLGSLPPPLPRQRVGSLPPPLGGEGQGGGVRWIGIAATILALALLFPSVPYPTDTAVVPAFFRGGDVRRIPQGDVVLVAPFSRAFTSDAMMWQSVAGMSFRMPEGYGYRPGPTRNPPDSALQTQLNAIYYGLDRPSVSPGLVDQMRAELANMGATAVIVGPEPRQEEVVALFRGLLGREPVETGGVLVWWNVR